MYIIVKKYKIVFLKNITIICNHCYKLNKLEG